jgi:cathepsin L
MWMREEQKVYSSPQEAQLRHGIWLQNKAYIDAANEDETKTYKLAMNEYGDLTSEEFQELFLARNNPGFNANARNTQVTYDIELAERKREVPFWFWYAGGNMATPDATVAPAARAASLPSAIDWRAQGVVGPVKNQGGCGACWSFSASGALESANAIITGKLKTMSEQALVDCSSNSYYGNSGCNGGNMDSAFSFVSDNLGLDSDLGYKYTGSQSTCKSVKANSAGIVSAVAVIPEDESLLTAALANLGPVAVAIDASRPSFQFYSSGVYNEPTCSSSVLNHGVLAVGYGTQNGQDYYIVKNSWGNWGLGGYILMSRNKGNQCGIASMASAPIVAGVPKITPVPAAPVVTSPCASSPCRNNAVCAQTSSGFTCTCAAGYTGLLCQSDINECLSKPCLNSGACVQKTTGPGFTCTCAAGFTGLLCQSALAPAVIPTPVDSGLLANGLTGAVSVRAATDSFGIAVTNFAGGYLTVGQNLVDAAALTVNSFVVAGYLQGTLPVTASRTFFARSQEASPANNGLQYLGITFLADMSISISYQTSGTSMQTLKLSSSLYPAFKTFFTASTDADSMPHFAVAFSQSALVANSLTVVVYVDGAAVYTSAKLPNKGSAGLGNPYRIGGRAGTTSTTNWAGSMKAVNYVQDALGLRGASQTNMLCDAAGGQYFCASRKSCPTCKCSSTLAGITCA